MSGETWDSCDAPIVDDIIRWNEPIWAAPTKKRGKPDAIGEQRITAAITAMDEFVELKVRAVEALSLLPGIEPAPLKVKPGDNIRRKFATITAGDCHKLK